MAVNGFHGDKPLPLSGSSSVNEYKWLRKLLTIRELQ